MINEDDGRSTTESLHLTDQHDVTWYSSDTPTDSEGVPLPTDSEGIPLPADAEGVPLPEKSISTQIPIYTTQNNGVSKALNNGNLLIISLIISYSRVSFSHHDNSQI